MMISTRGRYAMRVMVDLAENRQRGYVPMKEIAERQEISLKYIEQIISVLSKNSLIEGVRGKGGGYRLSRPPAGYTAEEVLRLTEGDLAPVACLQCGRKPCSREKVCRTKTLWKGLDAVISQYLESVTLEDLMEKIAERQSIGNKEW